MPLLFGAVFIVGFALGWLPRDMIVSSNMIAVGTIAFNVLVIHSGTMIDLRMLRAKKADVLIALTAALVLAPVVSLGLRPFIGRELALLAPGAVVGGGASCAIASRWVLDAHPGIAVFPWMIFMFQGLFSVPVVTWALKKEAAALLAELRAKAPAAAGGVPLPAGPPSDRPPAGPPMQAPHGLCARLPASYKTTAYYLGSVMLVAVLNKWLHAVLLIPNGVNVNINATALLFGLILGQAGLLDPGPLNKSDSYGLLLLGLMGLMANTMANNPPENILRLLPPLLLVFVVSTAVLTTVGALGARKMGLRPSHGIALTMNCVMGFPVNGMLVKNAASVGADERERGYLAGRLAPLLGVGTMLIGNAVSIFLVSFLVALV